jgi:hypothetical protein
MVPAVRVADGENFFRSMAHRALTSPRKLVIIKGVAFKGRTSTVAFPREPGPIAQLARAHD